MWQSKHGAKQFAYPRNPKKFSYHCLRFSVAPKGELSGAHGEQSVPNRIPVTPMRIPEETKEALVAPSEIPVAAIRIPLALMGSL